jgi:hypothetical protein
MVDLQTLDKALRLADFDNISMGTANVVYVSIPDDSGGATTTCNLGLPALPGGWTYQCSNTDNYRKADGTGWIPVNFTSLTTTPNPLTLLPVDPTNSTSTGLYYTYVNGSWELTALFETTGYQQRYASSDNGTSTVLYEVGNHFKITPDVISSRINTANTASGGPTVTVSTLTTSAATNVSSTLATLNGSITDEGNASSTITGFDYGLTTSYGSTTTSTYSGGLGSFSNAISGLIASTLYHFRAKSYNSAGWGYGSDQTLTTSVAATIPAVPQSLTATPGDTQIVLNWSVPSSDGGSSITNYKVYRGISSGGEIFLSSGGCSGLGNVLTCTDTGLTNGTAYYYKVSAVNGVGESSQSSEANATPTSPVTVPTISTNAATDLAATAATLNGSITAEGGASSTIVGFDYGLTDSYGSQATSTYSGGTGAFTKGITGLTASTLYHFRAKSYNSAGWGYGSDNTLTTNAPSGPQVGYIYPNGDGATLQWGITPSSPTTHYTKIDDEVVQPNVPDTSDYVAQMANGAAEVYEMSSISSVSSVSQIVIWAYGYVQNGGGGIPRYIYIQGVNQTGGVLTNFTATNGWQSATFTGSWTQADLDSLQVRIVSVMTGPSKYIYALYGEVTYMP